MMDPMAEAAQRLAWQMTVCAALNDGTDDSERATAAALDSLMTAVPNPWAALAGSVSISVRLLDALAEERGTTLPELTGELGRLMALDELAEDD